MILKNKKGFFMTETLVVIVFIATIFTFIYISVIPLIGIYEDKSERENDIDIVYKLYNIKQFMEKNSNTLGITSNNVSDIKCEKINNLPEEENYCNKLMDILGLTNYELYYVNGIKNNINNGMFNEEIKTYLEKYKDEEEETIILLDTKTHKIAHLNYKNKEIDNTISSDDTSNESIESGD